MKEKAEVAKNYIESKYSKQRGEDQ